LDDRVGLFELVLTLRFVIIFTVVHLWVPMRRAVVVFTSALEAGEADLLVALKTARDTLLHWLADWLDLLFRSDWRRRRRWGRDGHLFLSLFYFFHGGLLLRRGGWLRLPSDMILVALRAQAEALWVSVESAPVGAEDWSCGWGFLG